MSNSSLKTMPIGEAFKKLSRAEQELDFFNLSYFGVPVWIYPREDVSFILNGMAQSSGQFEPHFKINVFVFLSRIFYFFINFYKIFNNEVIIFTNERHLQWNEKEQRYYNPYAELAVESNKFKKVLIFEFFTGMTKKYKKTKYKKYLPLDFFIGAKQILSPLSFFFSFKIKREFNGKLNRANLWSEQGERKIIGLCVAAGYSINYYGLILKFIKILNPKAKFIYSCMAAFDKFPEVIEIQHGAIARYHCQYIYPKTESIKDYLKNKKIIVFSDKVKKLFYENEYSLENVLVKPNPKIYFYFLKNLEENFFITKHITNKITIVSGFGWNFYKIYKEFLLSIEKNKDKLSNWEFFLLLHPVEDNGYRELSLTKVKIFRNNEASLWDLLSESLCMVNIYSSVMEESPYFGCFNVILENKELAEQKYFSDWLCGDYPNKEFVAPEKFAEWLLKNEQKIINHREKKLKIMENNYKYFLEYKNL